MRVTRDVVSAAVPAEPERWTAALRAALVRHLLLRAVRVSGQLQQGGRPPAPPDRRAGRRRARHRRRSHPGERRIPRVLAGGERYWCRRYGYSTCLFIIYTIYVYKAQCFNATKLNKDFFICRLALTRFREKKKLSFECKGGAPG